ncbi:MAG: transcription elongation factor GreAB [Sphingobium sp. 66-54]|nr:MAG: transcription elongation factor GreAB [Sphingobium sp. 66-54]
MTSSKSSRRPPVHMIDSEADALTSLALGIEDRLPEVSERLLDEISRANIHTAERIPADVVTMRSTVSFTDEASGAERSVQLVYPKDADISAGKISILTLIGAGLIGLREAQSIVWPDRSGHERVLRITRVTQP